MWKTLTSIFVGESQKCSRGSLLWISESSVFLEGGGSWESLSSYLWCSRCYQDLLSLLVLNGTVELTLSSKSSPISHMVGGNSHSCPPTSFRPRPCWTSSSEEVLLEEQWFNIVWCKPDTI